jgi:4-amino-4-deoxy-L-arabinose transferase-like glycosyltransferase
MWLCDSLYMSARKYPSIALIAILILATGARLYYIQSQSVWFDEGWSAYAANQPTLPAALQADPTNPPLYYGLLNLFARGFGDSTLALRWVSTLLGLLLIPLAYQLGKRLFNQRAGVMAAFLTAFCPLLWWASQEIRMYTLLALLVTGAALAWHSLLRRSSWRAWFALWGCELALLYAHNTGPIVALWLNAVTFLVWLSDFITKSRLRNAKHNNLAASSALSTKSSVYAPQHSALLWLGGQIGVALLWSPWFISRFVRLPEANSAVGHISPMSFGLLSRLWQAVWTGSWAMVGQESLLVALSALLAVLALLLIPWRQAAARWLVLHVLLLTGGVWLGLALLGNEIHGRYLVMIAPLLLVAIGAGFARLFSESHGASVGARHVLPLLGIGVILLTFLASVHFATTNPAYQHDDARGMVQYYADHLTANDTVLDWSYADRYELAYYWNRLGVRAHRVTLPEGGDLDQILPLLPKSGDVALNVWYTQRADYRGMMSCLLGNGTINPPEQFTVYGMSDLLYRAPSLDLPELKLVNISVADKAQITAVGGIHDSTANRALCLPIKLTLTQKMDVDLKMAVVVDWDGIEVARADAIFANAVQQTTSQLAAGDTVTAYPLLRLPYGAPAGTYSSWLTVYDEQKQPSGYDLNINEGGPPRLKQVLIGQWRVLPGSHWEQVNWTTDLPVTVDVPASSDLTLIADNLTEGTFRNGDTLRLALLWKGTGTIPDLTLADTAGKWSIPIPTPPYHDRDTIMLDWREAHIPPDAPSGTAEVRLPDGTVIGRYTIESLPALYSPPAFDRSVKSGEFSQAGNLIGYTISGDMTDRSQPFTLTLVWWALHPTDISYTVFAQLVTDDGRVLAQSDSIPAGNTRPTTGWRDGEYIVDTHQVVFHDDAAPGTARLIVGLYDAATGQRLATVVGGDFVTLQEGIVVR